MSTPAYLTIEYIREELQDQMPSDNSIDCDLFFSDKDILHAMERAAARYNQLPPVGIDPVSPSTLPASSGIFLDAVLAQLYGSAIHKLNRNQVQWSTGEVTVDLEGKRLQAFEQAKAALDKQWREDARDRKAEINRSLCWGYF